MEIADQKKKREAASGVFFCNQLMNKNNVNSDEIKLNIM